MGILILGLCLCFCSVLGSDTYRAAVVDTSKVEVNCGRYADLIRVAAKNNVDVVVLPSPKNDPSEALELCMNDLDNYDEIVKSVSSAAKEGQVYVVAHLYERTLCENDQELIRNNLVFNRNGAIVSVYRKQTLSKCNATMPRMGQFTTDFGVTFGVLMEEDVLLSDVKELDGFKNFIVAGSSISKTKFWFAKQFPSSWAFANSVNLITANGVLFGNTNVNLLSEQLTVAEFEKQTKSGVSQLRIPPVSFSTGDMSQYIIKSLDVGASTEGITETVCQGTFCCRFYVKTSIGSEQGVTYGLVVFDGVQKLGLSNIGVQTCSIVACAGLHERSCSIGSENNSTNVIFDKISINGTFSKDNSAYFPTILTSTQEVFNGDNFKLQNKNSNYITTELYYTENVLNIGIITRVYSRDFHTSDISSIKKNTKYVSSRNLLEFIDYLWITLRVLVFIVSLYFLEMM